MFKLFLIILPFITAIPQKTENNDQAVINIFKEIITQNNTGKKIVIQTQLYKNVLEGFDFHSASHYRLDTSKPLAIDRPDWKGFINIIDIAQIKDDVLPVNFYDKRVKVYKSSLSEEIKSGRYKLYTFSPVIFSPSGKKAVCALRTYSSSLSGGKYVYFLQKTAGKWKIVEIITVSIS